MVGAPEPGFGPEGRPYREFIFNRIVKVHWKKGKPGDSSGRLLFGAPNFGWDSIIWGVTESGIEEGSILVEGGRGGLEMGNPYGFVNDGLVRVATGFYALENTVGVSLCVITSVSPTCDYTVFLSGTSLASPNNFGGDFTAEAKVVISTPDPTGYSNFGIPGEVIASISTTIPPAPEP